MSTTNLFRKYNYLIDSHPIKTKTATCFFIFGLGDYLCQKIELKFEIIKEYSIKRCLLQGSFGIVAAPLLHLQFCYIIPRLFPEHLKYSIIKTLLYALTLNDGFFNFMFYFYMDLLSGKSFETTVTEFKKKYPQTMIDNWKFWPVISGINFTYVPIQYRVLFDNFGCIFWNIYLSYMQNKKQCNVSEVNVNDIHK
jgi:peroxisomal membrane protein 2